MTDNPFEQKRRSLQLALQARVFDRIGSDRRFHWSNKVVDRDIQNRKDSEILDEAIKSVRSSRLKLGQMLKEQETAGSGDRI